MKSNLAVRLITALVAVPILLALLFVGPTTGWFALVLLASGIAGWEFFGMTHPTDRVARAVGTATTGTVCASFYCGAHDPRWLLSATFVATTVGALTPLWRLGDLGTAGLRTIAGIAGPFYVGATLAPLALMRRDLGADGAAYVLLVLCFAWGADTGGYFVGRFLGKHKLYEAVSPKKTREGFLGALGGACLGGLVAHFWFLPSLPLGHALPLALACGALGQLGDLVESVLKRSTGIKDSGGIVPGHGGILDRIDAILLVGPLIYLYTLWS